MRTISISLCAAVLLLAAGFARADKYDDTVQMFKNAGTSGTFADSAYGYAVFPTIAKGGLGIGAAHGDGRVYADGQYVGDTKMTQVSAGLIAGGQTFSEIIFFQDKRALDEFMRGNFEFGAGVSAVVLTSAASAEAGTQGANSGASEGKNKAATAGGYHKGVAIFTIAKGGIMADASVAGQKFSYKPKQST